MLGLLLCKAVLFLMINCLDCVGDQCHAYSILCALQYTTSYLVEAWYSLEQYIGL